MRDPQPRQLLPLNPEKGVESHSDLEEVLAELGGIPKRELKVLVSYVISRIMRFENPEKGVESVLLRFLS